MPNINLVMYGTRHRDNEVCVAYTESDSDAQQVVKKLTQINYEFLKVSDYLFYNIQYPYVGTSRFEDYKKSLDDKFLFGLYRCTFDREGKCTTTLLPYGTNLSKEGYPIEHDPVYARNTVEWTSAVYPIVKFSNQPLSDQVMRNGQYYTRIIARDTGAALNYDTPSLGTTGRSINWNAYVDVFIATAADNVDYPEYTMLWENHLFPNKTIDEIEHYARLLRNDFVKSRLKVSSNCC